MPSDTEELTITYQRYERECNFNEQVREGKYKGPPIYDFRVMVDGQPRAVMSRRAGSQGYMLRDLDQLPINFPGPRSTRHDATADKQADFDSVVLRALQLGVIPTAAQLEERRRERAAKAERDEAARQRALARHLMQNAGPELYAVLERVKFAFAGSVGEQFAALIPDTVHDMDAAMAHARGELFPGDRVEVIDRPVSEGGLVYTIEASHEFNGELHYRGRGERHGQGIGIDLPRSQLRRLVEEETADA